MQDRKPLDGNAYAVMVLLTALWGFQQVTIKLAASPPPRSLSAPASCS